MLKHQAAWVLNVIRLVTGQLLKEIVMSDLQLHNVYGEQRILDVDLGERLGYITPTKIREIIKRNLGELRDYGECKPLVDTGPEVVGRPSEYYYLNRDQSLFVVMKSETDKAREVRREVIRVYGHYLEGQLTYIREPEWEILKNDLEILAAERSDLLKKLENVNRRVAAKVDRLTDLKMKVDSVLEYVQTGSYNESVFVTSVYGDTTLHAPSKEPKLN